MAIRDRFNRLVERHEIAWELAMGGLALVWVALGFLVDQIGSGVRPELEATELLLTGVFVAEFVSRLAAAHDRGQYVRSHWIDALALAPPIRAFRLLRLLRLLRLVRAFAGFYRAAMHVQGLARHRGFAWLIVAWLTVMVVCSAFVYTAEHGANKLIDTPFDALWWGVSTLTTVGYGDTYPITPEGRIGAMDPDAPWDRPVLSNHGNDHELLHQPRTGRARFRGPAGGAGRATGTGIADRGRVRRSKGPSHRAAPCASEKPETSGR